MKNGNDHRTDRRKVGDIGEKIAKTFLVKRGFDVIQRNYLKKCGEIDIICKKGDKLYFVEVKSVSRETFSRETSDQFRPEDNIHRQKIERMNRAIQIYLEEHAFDGDWEIIAVVVEIHEKLKTAHVKLLDGFAW